MALEIVPDAPASIISVGTFTLPPGAKASAEILARCQQAASLAGQVRREQVLALMDLLGDAHPFVRWEAARALAHTAQVYQGRPRLGTSLVARRSPTVSWEELLDLMRQALHAPEAELRAAAADGLGLWRQAAVVPILAEALSDSEASVRVAAADALGRIGDQEPVGALGQALRDPSLWVQRAAADALGQIGDPRAVELLIAALEGASPPAHSLVRSAAVAALGHIESGAARRALLVHLRDPDVEVRFQAVRALGRVGTLRALPALETLGRDRTLVAGEHLSTWARRAIVAIQRREIGFPNALLKGLYALRGWLRARWIAWRGRSAPLMPQDERPEGDTQP